MRLRENERNLSLVENSLVAKHTFMAFRKMLIIIS